MLVVPLGADLWVKCGGWWQVNRFVIDIGSSVQRLHDTDGAVV
jgi:hypothetical protein